MSDPIPTEPLRFDTADAKVPRVWLLMGHKAGDNTQVLALAEALGWPFEIKRFVYRKYELITNLVFGCTLAGVVSEASSSLGPPWPDLVISAGRRNEPVARWIQRQADERVRLVHMGRPWAALRRFDLIVTTPQYQLPESPNLVRNMLPLHRVTQARLAAEATKWTPEFAHLPRPWIAVLLGGDSGPFVFTPDKGARLGRQINRMAKESGGAVLVSDSARTPAAAFDAFQAELEVPAHVYRWRASRGDNPYFGYLAVADRIVVTGESMSMLTEAFAAGKPLIVFDLSDRVRADGTGEREDPAGREQGRPWWRLRHNFRFKPLSHRLAMRFGPRRLRRDVGAIQEHLVASGRAVWSGQPCPEERQPLPLGDLERAAERVRGLFES